jgi:hypothetical protein
MAEGISAYMANATLNAVGNNISFAVATTYVQLHTAAPGAAGTSNVATETTRKAVSFGAASAGAIANDADVSWTNIAGSQDATHFTVWDASSAGNFLFSGVITGNGYIAGDTYVFPAGEFTASFTLAS